MPLLLCKTFGFAIFTLMKSPSPPLIVDLHVHLFPRRMFIAIWDYFESRSWPVHREHVDQIAKTLAAHGVSRAVGLSYPHKPKMARQLNRFMAQTGEQLPLFHPFASVFPDDEDFADTVEEVFSSSGLYGFKFHPLVQKFDLNDSRLDGLYELCLHQDFPLLVHAGTAPESNPYVGFTHFKRLMQRFPELRICVAHMGGFEFDAFLSALDDFPKMYLDTTMINTRTDLFDTTWRGNARHLERHADRLCYGSDWPNVPYPYQEALDSVARFPLPEEKTQAILGKNALRFLRLLPQNAAL